MKFLLLFCACGYVVAQPQFAVYNAAGGFEGGLGTAPGSLVEAGYLPNTPAPPPALDPATVTLQLYSTPSSDPINLPVLGPATSITVLALVPANVPLGFATVRMLVNGTEQGSHQVSIVSAGLGIFSKGFIAAAQNVMTDGSVVANALTAPAKPGGFVTLWGTGLGNKTASDVTVTLGGIPAIVTYAGHSGEAGLDQINIQIPNDPSIPLGCYVAVEASVPVDDGATPIETSNRVSISLAPKGAQACTHPLNLTADEMRSLDSGGTIPMMIFGLQSSVSPAPGKFFSFTRSDDSFAEITRRDAMAVAAVSGGMLQAPSALFGCHAPIPPPLGGGFYGGLNAGDALTLSGPSAQTFNLPVGGTAYSYSNYVQSPPADTPDAVTASFFVPGTWSLTAPGGADVSSFSVPLSLSHALRITNTEALVDIDAGKDLVVSWDTTGLQPNQMVTVSLLSTVPCSGPALQGSLTIPSNLVAASIRASLPTGPGPWLEAELFSQPGAQPSFSVPLAGGESMAGAMAQFSREDVLTVIEPSVPAIYPGAIGNQNGTQNTSSNGAAPGSTIAIWATGLSGNVTVTAIVSGQTVIPSYAGPAPGLPGEQQVNLTVPAGLGPGPTQVSVCRTPASGPQVCSKPAPLTID